MYKFLLFILPLFLFISSPAKADVLEWQQAKQNIENQRQELKSQLKQIKSLPKAQQDEAMKHNIKIVMQDNKLAAYQNAYDTAINYIEQQENYSTALNFLPVTMLLGEIVPKEYIPYYKAAGERYGVDWSVLAAIHETETNFSRDPKMISSVGAIGHMQFMPSTFAKYGVDGDGDGFRSAWNLQDSVFSAANYLSASGFKKEPRKAIWSYNHADWYVNKVIAEAERIKEQ
jgi:membrane-bound lytic murein transglycosylase B